ncbi:hypothetical protein DL93DRAFT_2091574 [Clavulina sp. PMI_390]|nr:hypothetical protein DL93DRAFT_2091574 [Clavulina sp. PMI_390]
MFIRAGLNSLVARPRLLASSLLVLAASGLLYTRQSLNNSSPPSSPSASSLTPVDDLETPLHTPDSARPFVSAMASNLTISSTLKLNTGYEIPQLGFGVFQIDNDGCTDACLAAFQAGYRHIDSAVYYQNEAGVGKALRQSGLKREEVFITSKILSMMVQGYDSTLKAVDRSLQQAGLDYYDLYLIHDPLSGKERRINMWKGLVQKQKEGKIRTIGVSNFGVRHLKEIKAAGLPLPAVNQVELHPYCQQRDIVKFCEDNGIVVEAYSPLIRGKVDPTDAISRIAASKKNVDAFQILVRWSLQKGYVPLPKSQRPAKIRHNANVYDFELPAEEMAAIDALDRGAQGAVMWNPTSAP